MKKQPSGFTLIELMIVVAIIGILAAIALPAYQSYTARAQVAEAMSLAGGAKTAVAEFYSQTGDWPSDNAAAGLADAENIKGNYVAKVEIGKDGAIVATMASDGVSQDIGGKTVTLTPTVSAGSFSWACTSDAPAATLPKVCASSADG